MKVLWCWSRLSGYMASGWRALSKYEDIDLKVLAWATEEDSEVAFKSDLVDGVDCHLMQRKEYEDYEAIRAIADEFQPEVIVVGGWMSVPYQKLAKYLAPKGVAVFMGMDTPWEDRLKQRLTPYRYRSFLQCVDRVVTAGERTWQYAKQLGFEETQIHRPVYCYDSEIFYPAEAGTYSVEDRRRFLFVGRYVPVKGLDLLIDAYQSYRQQVDNPWGFTCAGMGELKSELAKVEGINDVGFTDPRDLPELYRSHGALLLPSYHEPWGVVIAEAMGCGLPVIASEACGAGVDLIRQYCSGIATPTGDTKSLLEAMLWMHRNEDQLDDLGQTAAQLALPFRAHKWAERWREWIRSSVS